MTNKMDDVNGGKRCVNDEEDSHNVEQTNALELHNETPKGWGVRHQQCFILFCCLTTAYSMRSCMGVALVAMTSDSQTISGRTINTSLLEIGISELANITNTTDNLHATHGDNHDDVDNGFLNMLMMSEPYPVFRWSKQVQDTILSSFFWGYMTLQIPAGQLAHRFGAKYLICATMGINAVLSICLPWASFYGGWISTVILRIIQGLSQACFFPSSHTFFGKWAPLQERGRLTALVYGGQALGTVLGLPITGFLASSSLGWPGIFRFYGILSGLVGFVWWYYGADTPALHPTISTAEREYIEKGLGQAEGDSKKQLPVPWKSILTCKGMWAIVIAHIGHTWGQLILYSEVPAYMDKVMKVNIKANGLLTALPFLVMFFANFVFSWMTDFIINRKYLSVTNTRKLANTIGCWPPALGLITLAYAPHEMYVVETLLIVICALKISGHLGFQVNHIDISPNFAGTMMSISNFSSNLVASFAPIVAGLILTDPSDATLWRSVFFLAAGFYFFSNLFYLIFGTAEKAEWNDPSKKNDLEGHQAESLQPMLKTLVAQ